MTIGSIPVTALEAYHRAASILAGASSCRLPWTLLAGVGRVESDHGRHGGARLGTDGVSRPTIIGVPLNGLGPVAAVRDTDAGVLDGDQVWDRAVGPLQFIPSTWAVVGVDADGDGRRSPNDIEDAALAAGIYLCTGTSRLDDPGKARAALLRYNRSSAYVSLVMAYAERYAADISSTGPPTRLVDMGRPALEHLGVHGGRSRRANAGSDAARVDAHAGPAPARPGTPAPVSADPTPTAAAPSTGSVDPASEGPPDPPPTGETPPTASPPPPPVDPSPEVVSVPPAPQVLEGTWTECDAGSCLDGHVLGLSDPPPTCEVADYDGDGGTEQLATELAGLGGQTVAVTALSDDAGWLVLEIRGLAWPRGTESSAGPGCADGAGSTTLPEDRP